MTADPLADALAGHFRYERANEAARRFISRSVETELPRSAVVGFLQGRREPLPADQIEVCADEAISRWLRSRLNRYRGPRR